MPSPTDHAPASLPALNTTQRNRLASARAWWQEGERSLDYFEEKAHVETLLARTRPLAEALRQDRDSWSASLPALLHLVRQITGNHALNRGCETSVFADAVCDLLWGEAPLITRLQAFGLLPAVGMTTASHLLYAAFPDRYPMVSPIMRRFLSPSRQQMQQARQYALLTHSAPADLTAPVRDLLADFVLYETALRHLNLSQYTDLHLLLRHAGEMPRSNSTRRARNRVRETSADYTVEAPEKESSPAPCTENDLLRLIEAEIESRGFSFPPLLVRNYYIALKAKPFVIFTGLSGTGKTRLTRLLADALTGNNPDQYLLIAVRPDWHDSSGLLGYYNLLTDRYIGTPFLDMLHRAGQAENRERLFCVCLDEMNLARVEHYFAEALSAMETEDGRILLQEGRTVALPDNLLLTGSVNMDEATHAFSRKVLDRANTIEFVHVDLRRGEQREPAALLDVSPLERQRIFRAGQMRSIAEAENRLLSISSDFAERITALLSELNDLLTPRSMHFGYRVRDEVFRYCAAAFSIEGEGLLHSDVETNLQIALDFQMLQKVLPRLSGTTDGLMPLLRQAEAMAQRLGLERTASKIARMQVRAIEEGFVSFYEI